MLNFKMLEDVGKSTNMVSMGMGINNVIQGYYFFESSNCVSIDFPIS